MMNNPSDSNQFPPVYIRPLALTKLKAYIKHSPVEISGLGTVTIDQDELIVEDLFTFEQECSATETELDQDSLARFYTQCLQQGIDTSQFHLYWHSHVNMGTFWSGTDQGTIDKFDHDWMLSIVGNKQNEFRTRLDLWQPFRCTMDQLNLYEYREIDWELDKQIEAEVKQKVRVKTYPAVQSNFQQWAGGTWNNNVWTPTARPETSVTVEPAETVDPIAEVDQRVAEAELGQNWQDYYDWTPGSLYGRHPGG